MKKLTFVSDKATEVIDSLHALHPPHPSSPFKKPNKVAVVHRNVLIIDVVMFKIRINTWFLIGNTTLRLFL
jgi:hypothetical protein